MLLSCLRRVAAQAQEDGRIELRLVRPALVDPDILTLLANDLIEVADIESGKAGLIVYRLTERARMMADTRPLLSSRTAGSKASWSRPRFQPLRRSLQ